MHSIIWQSNDSEMSLWMISHFGAIVVMIAWYLDLQLSMQSVPNTTNIVSSNLTQERYTRYIMR